MNLTPGMHLLTNVDLNDFECPRISRAHDRFASLCPPAEFARDPLAHRAQLAHLLADHSTQLDAREGRPNALCQHMGDYGTRSASLIFELRDGSVSHFFAPGTAVHGRLHPRADSRRFVKRQARRGGRRA